MNAIAYRDPIAFHADVIEDLSRAEAVNNLPIGLLDRAVRGEPCDGWFMARVADDAGTTLLIALMTPPQNLLLAVPGGEEARDAADALSAYLVREGISVPGVQAESAVAHAFARAHANRVGVATRVTENLRVYRLDRVNDVPRIGALRMADARDMHYLPYWMSDFSEACFGKPYLDGEGMRAKIAEGRYFVLEVDGQPVSFAGTSRQMPHGRSVGPVYTPPYLRGRGYASSCVAQLSERILARGNEYCVLFTDLANPTSNHIYREIGYVPMADFAQIRFGADAGEA